MRELSEGWSVMGEYHEVRVTLKGAHYAASLIEDEDELARTRAMLKQVRAVMPEAWAPSLDAKVDQHLDKTSKPETLK